MQDLNKLLRKAKYQSRQKSLDESLIRQEEVDRLYDISLKKCDERTQYFNDYKLARGRSIAASLDSSFRSEVELFGLASVIDLQKLCIKAYPEQLTIYNFNISAKFDWSLRRTRSWGGCGEARLGISMAMISNTMLLPFLEYSCINNDPERVLNVARTTLEKSRQFYRLEELEAAVAACDLKIAKYKRSDGETEPSECWSGCEDSNCPIRIRCTLTERM